jgi:hypothetical protein
MLLGTTTKPAGGSLRYDETDRRICDTLGALP